MRVAMSPSRARAVARNATEVPARRACSSAWRLLPLRAPPRTRRECGATVTRVLPRRPVRSGGVGQVSWLSDRPTPRPFPVRLVPDQWPIAGFVPDYSDGVAADSHRLPWGPRPAGRPTPRTGATVTEREAKGKAGPAREGGRPATSARDDRYPGADAWWAAPPRAGDRRAARAGIHAAGAAGSGPRRAARRRCRSHGARSGPPRGRCAGCAGG